MIKIKMQEIFLKIFGNVQGVGLRYSTRVKARELSLTGWVKNEPNGSVMIVAQGEKQKLEKLIQWIHTAPTLARVENVEVKWRKLGKIFLDFEIRY